MNTNAPDHRGYRFASKIISHAAWLYYRFSLSFGDVEDLLAERGITVSYETIRQWCLKFGPEYARALKRRQGRAWVIPGTSTSYSSKSVANDSIYGVPSIRTAM